MKTSKITCTTNDRQYKGLLIALILYALEGQRVEAMDCSARIYDMFGIRADWHEYSFLLEGLAASGDATKDGFTNSGLARYIIGK